MNDLGHHSRFVGTVRIITRSLAPHQTQSTYENSKVRNREKLRKFHTEIRVFFLFLVPTLCVGTPVATLYVAPASRHAPQSGGTCVPTQSVGTRKVRKFHTEIRVFFLFFAISLFSRWLIRITPPAQDPIRKTGTGSARCRAFPRFSYRRYVTRQKSTFR